MKKCAFCTNRAESDEHIFSKWMLDMLPPEHRYVCNERLVLRDEYIKFTKKRPKVVAYAVCTQCNNNWMSAKIEGALIPSMKPLLLENPTMILTPEETTPIARFAFKTLVMANHKDLSIPPFFTSAQRFRFKRNLTIPGGVQVWMARRKVDTGYAGFWKSAYGDSNPKLTFSFRCYICTWNFQNVVLQILACKWENKRRRNTIPFPLLPQKKHWDDTVIPIWPNPSDLSFDWPPPTPLNAMSINEFRDRLNQIELSQF